MFTQTLSTRLSSWLTFGALALSLWGGLAQAADQEFTLFTRLGSPVENYNDIITRLINHPHGTETLIHMGDGRSFTVRRALGNGTATLILDVGGGKALRIPLRSRGSSADRPFVQRMLMGNDDPRALLNSYLDGYADFERYEAPVIRVYPGQSRRGRYILVDQANVLFTADQFFRDAHPQARQASTSEYEQALTAPERARIEEEFTDFVAGFWAFRKIGDASLKQVAYTPQGWILLDWTHENEIVASNDGRRGMFHLEYPNERMMASYFRLPHEHLQRLESTITSKILDKRHRNRTRLPFSCAVLMLDVLK